MKKNLLFLLMFSLLSSALIFTSCGDDDDGNGDNSSLAIGEMKMTVDGTEVTTSTTVVSEPSFNFSQMLIQATSGTTRVSLTCNDITEGTYLIDVNNLYTPGSFGNATYSPNYSDILDQYGSVSGSITLSEVTASTVSGTFNFVASKSGAQNVSVTSGEFYKLAK